MKVLINDPAVRDVLTRAAAVIDSLPVWQQEVSNWEDMLALLDGENTGRNDHIVLQAICYAAVDGLPVDPKMVRLRRHVAERNPDYLALIACGVKSHTGRAPDLGPEVNALVEEEWLKRVRHEAIEAAKSTLH